MDIEIAEQTLRKLNFDEKETKVYLSLLKLGETTVTKISQETNIERTLVYYIIDKLINRGLTSFKLKNNVKYYSASSPQNILEELKEKEKSFLDILPILKNLQNKEFEEDVKVNIYKGKEGLKAIISDMFKSNVKEFFILGEQGQIQTNYPITYAQYLKRLEKERVKEKVLVREDFKNKIEKSKNSKFKFLPKEMITPTTTLIYGNKVQITIWEKPMFNILIESKKVADSYKSYFKELWKIAKN